MACDQGHGDHPGQNVVDRHHDVKNHLRRFDHCPEASAYRYSDSSQRHPIDCDAVILVTAGDVITGMPITRLTRYPWVLSGNE